MTRQPSRYPGGVKTSDIRGLAGNLDTGTRQRARVNVGRVTCSQGTPAIPDIVRESDRRKRLQGCRKYFHERSNQRVQHPHSIEENTSLSLPGAVPPPLASPAAALNCVLAKTFSSADLLACMPGPCGDVRGPLLRASPAVRKKHLAHLQNSITQGSTTSAVHGSPVRKPVSAPEGFSKTFQRSGVPSFPPSKEVPTRLGATTYSETRGIVEGGTASAGFCAQRQRFEDKSRGLDVTWQKEAKVLERAVTDARLLRRVRHTRQIEDSTHNMMAREERKADSRAAAVANQHKRYAEQVGLMEVFKARQR